ncbi:hypothetical protein XENTR_v10020775 [Xenopus tropicalis]|nr:hypothetical protein XENTR_v10020775 [Xenopus tropicalis]
MDYGIILAPARSKEGSSAPVEPHRPGTQRKRNRAGAKSISIKLLVTYKYQVLVPPAVSMGRASPWGERVGVWIKTPAFIKESSAEPALKPTKAHFLQDQCCLSSCS